MHDGISLEKLGLPAAVVVTAEFLHEAEVQRAALGMDGLRPVVITHPLSSIGEAEIAERAEQVLVQAQAIWRGDLRAESGQKP